MQLKEIDQYFPESLTEEETNRLIVFRPINHQRDFKRHYLFAPVTECCDQEGLTLNDTKFHGVKGLPRGVNIFMSKKDYD